MFDRLDLILPEQAHDGPMQMALDEALLGEVSLPTLRIFRWESPCVTFGYFQKHAEVRGLHPGMPITRRWTGGGIVEHGRDLTFSLCIPRNHACAALPPAELYRKLHSLLVPWITGTTSGTVRLATQADAVSGSSCFSAPAPDDLLDGDRKILGGAQRRSGGALLYQGSLQCDSDKGDLSGMARALSHVTEFRSLDNQLMAKAVGLVEIRYGNQDWLTRR